MDRREESKKKGVRKSLGTIPENIPFNFSATFVKSNRKGSLSSIPEDRPIEKGMPKKRNSKPLPKNALEKNRNENKSGSNDLSNMPQGKTANPETKSKEQHKKRSEHTTRQTLGKPSNGKLDQAPSPPVRQNSLNSRNQPNVADANPSPPVRQNSLNSRNQPNVADANPSPPVIQNSLNSRSQPNVADANPSPPVRQNSLNSRNQLNVADANPSPPVIQNSLNSRSQPNVADANHELLKDFVKVSKGDKKNEKRTAERKPHEAAQKAQMGKSISRNKSNGMK